MNLHRILAAAAVPFALCGSLLFTSAALSAPAAHAASADAGDDRTGSRPGLLPHTDRSVVFPLVGLGVAALASSGVLLLVARQRHAPLA